MKNIKDFYDKTAAEWADKWYADESMLPCLKEFVSKFPHTPTILDLCCGAGYESYRMKKLGAEIVGIDFSEVSVKIARERNSDIEFHVEDMLNDYSYIGKFDGIAVIAGLIHIPNEKLSKAFISMSQVLNIDGLILLVVRDGTGKRAQQSYVTIDCEDYDREFYAHTLDELKEYSNGMFTFVEEILPDREDPWKRYLFKYAK
jgi:SAM-dependent methyltransferase